LIYLFAEVCHPTVVSDTQIHSGTGGRLETLPAEKCRAQHAGFGDYVYCVADDPYVCAHALSFGLHYFCLHAKRKAIAERTQFAKGGQ
jgi:hypothetical protein